MNNQKKTEDILTPVQLENLFNQYLSSISLATDEQEKIQLIVQFVQETFSLPEDLTYSFHLQLAAMFFFLTANFQPESISSEELEIYLETGINLYRRFSDKLDKNLFRESLSNLLFNSALSYFQLGELEEAYKKLLRKKQIEKMPPEETSDIPFETNTQIPELDFQEIKKSSDSNLDMLNKFFDFLPDKASFSQEQEHLLKRWENFRGNAQDSIYCCLVEKKGPLQIPARGRLVLLEAHCRPQAVHDGQNRIHFYNTSPFQKDEVYHLASDALEAADYIVRNFLKNELPPCALAFSFAEKRFLYSGQSLGLPLALLTISQKLMANLSRYSFAYKKEAAFSGKVDLNGQVLRLEPEALELKIKAAFYSGLRYLVIPLANLKEANIYLYKLLSIHPWRKLELIGVSRLDEVLKDKRLCIRKTIPVLTWMAKKKKSSIKKLLVGLFIVSLVLAIVNVFSKNPTLHFWKIRYPVLLEAHNSELFAFNQERQLLWLYHLPKPFDQQSLIQKIVDLNGDGNEEVLVCGNYLSDEKPNSELFCFSQKGKLLWRYRPGRKIKTPIDEFSNNYVTRIFDVATLKDGSSDKYIVLVANHATWYPTQISIINNRGELIGEYWNAGYLSPESLIIEDLDKDGWKEIILGGTNNDYQAACVIVLDPRKISGCSPASGTPDFQFEDIPRGTQEYYLLLPRTTLNQIMGMRNYVQKIEISREDKNLEVTTTEYSKDIDYEMKYNFDFNFNPIFSRPVDLMTEKVKEMVVSGLLPLNALTELKILKEKIRFWDGQSWVYKPARNKNLNF